MRELPLLIPEPRKRISLHIRRARYRGTGMPWWLTVLLVGAAIAVTTIVAVMVTGNWHPVWG